MRMPRFAHPLAASGLGAGNPGKANTEIPYSSCDGRWIIDGWRWKVGTMERWDVVWLAVANP
jgi:hypothetical protein